MLLLERDLQLSFIPQYGQATAGNYFNCIPPIMIEILIQEQALESIAPKQETSRNARRSSISSYGSRRAISPFVTAPNSFGIAMSVFRAGVETQVMAAWPTPVDPSVPFVKYLPGVGQARVKIGRLAISPRLRGSRTSDSINWFPHERDLSFFESSRSFCQS